MHEEKDIDPSQLENIETTQVGEHVYGVEELRLFAAAVPVREILVDSLKEAVGEGHTYWLDKNGEKLGPFQIIRNWHAAEENPAWSDHVQTIKRANLENPIWMMKSGEIFDGMHRLTKAFLENKKYIKVKMFDTLPESARVKKS